jgi:SAM-dependent methyltransferase
MPTPEELRGRARATWAAGDWDSFARLIAAVGALVIERAGIEPGAELLDVGTGTGGNVAIPAAQAGAKVVGLDVTPELLVLAREHGADAGVDVEWVEGDAAALPFADASFDRVVSTFGAMFAPDHAGAAAELVRVCRPGGRVLMTTWVNDGFVGEMFTLSGEFLPPPPPGVQPPPLWGVESHVREMFAAAGASPSIARETVAFDFASAEDVVSEYADNFGPFVMARGMLQPEGRWDEFLERFGDLVRRFNRSDGGRAQVESEYFLITVER